MHIRYSLLLLLLACGWTIAASGVDFGAVSDDGTETTVSTVQELIAAVQAAQPHDRIVMQAGEYQLKDSLKITTDHISIHGEGAEVVSAARRIFHVAADGFSLRGLKITGTGQGAAASRQTGIYSDIGRGGHLTELKISKVTECVKLDRLTGARGKPVERGADNWRIEGGEYRPIGKDDGEGYGIICGAVRNVQVKGGEFFGELDQDLRHALYLSAGASDSLGDGLIVHHANHASAACYAKEGQQPCRNNVFRNFKIDGQGQGAVESGCIELSGNCVGCTVEGNEIRDSKTSGIVVNTMGLTEISEHTIARNTIDGVERDGIRLLGAVDVQVFDNVIRHASQSQPGQRACICIVSWYQSMKKIAASKITIQGNELDDQGAREKITLNPTEPIPTDITVDGVKLELPKKR